MEREIIFLNSKTAALTVGSDFECTEDAAKKIAAEIGQLDNVNMYYMSGDKLIFSFDNGYEEPIEAEPEDDIDEDIIQAAFNYFDVSEAVMSVFRQTQDVNERAEGIKSFFAGKLNDDDFNKANWVYIATKIDEIFKDTTSKTTQIED